jgi:hypothetical protein
MPPPPRTTLLVGLLSGLACSLFSACAALPDWSHREIREVSVLVDYEMDGGDGFVVLPASNDWLTVLELQTRPGVMRETFAGKERRVQVPPNTHSLRVLCRYKLYMRRDRAGHPLPWPTAAELFPGATRIRHTTTDEDFLEEQQQH